MTCRRRVHSVSEGKRLPRVGRDQRCRCAVERARRGARRRCDVGQSERCRIGDDFVEQAEHVHRNDIDMQRGGSRLEGGIEESGKGRKWRGRCGLAERSLTDVRKVEHHDPFRSGIAQPRDLRQGVSRGRGDVRLQLAGRDQARTGGRDVDEDVVGADPNRVYRVGIEGRCRVQQLVDLN